MQAVSTGAGTGLFKKLGRVLREKAAGDLERVFKGTSKTRERLGVRDLPPCSVLCHPITLHESYSALQPALGQAAP